MKRKTSHKRHGFISMFWMPLTLYLVLLVTAFIVLTWHDTRNVWVRVVAAALTRYGRKNVLIVAVNIIWKRQAGSSSRCI